MRLVVRFDDKQVQQKRRGNAMKMISRVCFGGCGFFILVSTLAGAEESALVEEASVPAPVVSAEKPPVLQVDAIQVCGNPGPKPAAPKCSRVISSKVVRGGKVQTVQTPNEACVADPGWKYLDDWAAKSTKSQACVASLCAAKDPADGPVWGSCVTAAPGASFDLTCPGKRHRLGTCAAATLAWAQMATIPEGTVKIGSGIGTKQVARFSIDVTEVTVDAYATCVRAGNCSKPDDGQYCNWGRGDRGNHPVNCVDWNQAKAFCGWAQKRLPTEQEWQRAAESAQGRTYPWGEAAPSNQLCWNGEGSPVGKGNRQSTCAVGSFPSGDSAQGVKDLSGNVWEWTDSCYESSCAARVLRGGSWGHDNASRVRAAFRFGFDPSFRLDFGFRCSRFN